MSIPSVVPSPSNSALGMCAAPPPSGETAQTHEKINALVQLATATGPIARPISGHGGLSGRRFNDWRYQPDLLSPMSGH